MNYLPTSIGILGTCVSVDAFKFVEHEGLVSKTAMRDFSIFNTWDKRPSFNIGEIVHASSLHTMWLNTLWDGRVFEFLKENEGEYLMIDLTDERHELFMVDGCYFCCQGFIQTDLFNELKARGIEYEICSQSDFDEEEAQQRIKYFCSQVKRIYRPERIIINKFYLVDEYVKDDKVERFSSKGDIKLIEKSKTYFAQWYELLEREFPGCKTVEFTKKYRSDFRHIRGCSPFHPTTDYYSDTIAQIQRIVKDDYAIKRKRKVQKLSFGKEKLSDNELREMGADDYLAHLFDKILRLTEVKNKIVMYVGNRFIAHDFIRKLQIKKFIQIFDESRVPLNPKSRIYHFKDNYLSPKNVLMENNFAFYCGDLANITEDFLDLCDIIIVDYMEEIRELPGVLDNMYKCLRNEGELIGKTARTWSCSSGSKWYIRKDLNYLKPDDRIPMFPHLLLDYEEMRAVFSQFIGNAVQLNDMVTGMRESNSLNHLFYEDYVQILQNTLFGEKRICPVFPEKISEDIMEALQRKYPRYQKINFEYKSLYIYGKKQGGGVEHGY